MSEFLARIAALPPRKLELLAARYPLSYAQQRLWFLDRLEPGNASYNVPAALRLDGPLDMGILQRVLSEIARRHQVLRTSFPDVDGRPFQAVHPWRPAILPVIDLGGLPENGSERRLRALALAEAERPFDLARGPLLRMLMIRAHRRSHVLLLTLHHTVCDGWSLELLIDEMARLYDALSRGAPAPLAEPRLQYADFARWQRNLLSGERLERELDFWRARLGNGVPALELPTDRPRPAFQTFRGAAQSQPVPAALTRALRDLGQRAGASLFITLVTAYEVLLWRYTGQRDLTLGTPVVHRERRELEGLIGCFLNTLVLRLDLDPRASFERLQEKARELLLEVYDHQDLPFEKLVDELQPERSLSRQPLFQVMFTVKSPRQRERGFADLRASVLPVTKSFAKFDLTLTVHDRGERLELEIEYDTMLFDRTTILRALGHLHRLLEAVVAAPRDPVELLRTSSPAERHQLLREWNDSAGPRDLCAPQHRFEERAAACPEAVAFSCGGGEQVSYGELERRSAALARRLRGLGVGPGDLVAVAVPRAPALLVALLGILRAGSAYLPLDPEYPGDRLRFMLEDSGARVLVTDPTASQLDTGAARVELAPQGRLAEDGATAIARGLPGVTSPDELAYVIYTSGSTGLPKGVAVSWSNLTNLFDSLADSLRLTARDRVLALTTVSFDISTLELLLPFCCGAVVELVDEATARDGRRLTGVLERVRPTVVQATPSTWRMLVDAGWRGLPEGRVLSGGEALAGDLARLLTRRVGELWNVYGPTETTVWSTVARLGDEVSLGRPVANTRVVVADRRLHRQPIGVSGQIVLGGVGVARGYLGRPGLTAGRFVPDPWSTAGELCGAGARLYQTGDLGRLRADGRLDYLGRLDHQVKIRGFRVEPGEIETVLRAHPAVRDAAVAPRRAGGPEMVLVAYLETDAEVSTDALRQHVARRLQSYMVPALFVHLDRLPRTANGKLDRAALPEPAASRASRLGEAGYSAPRTAVEEILCGLYAELLELETVGVDDSFFELGGHSLLATRLLSRVRRALGVELPVRDLFESPTAAGFGARIEAARGQHDGLQVPPLTPRPPDVEPPLSFAQQRLWLVDQLRPGSAAYNLFRAVRFRGPLKVAVLRRSLEELAARHEALRAAFPARDGRPQVRFSALPPALPMIDLAALAASRRRREELRLCRAVAERPFELSRGNLLRAVLLRLGSEEHAALFTVHHIISDAWSLGVMVRELVAFYGDLSKGRPPALGPLPIQYADFAWWQRRWLRDETVERLLGYWRSQLDGASADLELPTDRPRPAAVSDRGGSQRLLPPPALAAGAGRLALQRSATPFMVWLAVFMTLLHRHTRRRDLCVGSPVAGRRWLETEPLIGFFVNTLVLRGHLRPENTFEDLLAQLREITLESQAHQDLPFERLVEELAPQREPGRSPLFEAAFVFQNVPAAPLRIEGLELEPIDVGPCTVRFDLTLFLVAGGDGPTAHLDYRSDLFDATTVARWGRHLLALAAAVCRDPGGRLGELPLLAAAEQHQVLSEWSRGNAAHRDAGVLPELFSAQAQRTPDAVALVTAEASLSYGELNRRANRLAGVLISRGVGPEDRVGILFGRGAEMVVALWGVLKAGGAYVPLDPAYPPERLCFMLQDAGVRLCLASAALLAHLEPSTVEILCPDRDGPRLLATAGDRAAEPRTGPENLAYVIYTSGSTGRPKGVAIEHRALASYVAGVSRRLGLGGLKSFATVSTLAADLGHTAIFPALTSGACLHVIAQDLIADPQGMACYFERRPVDCLKIVPGHLKALLQAPWPARLVPRRRLVLGGEAAPAELLAQLGALALPCGVYNHYGPTEATIGVTAGAFDPAAGGPPVLGRPLAGNLIRVLDETLRMVPAGATGEILIGGIQLARGYHGRPRATAERFVPDPWAPLPGARLYRTGDRARLRPDGGLEHRGRIDHQIKLRGYRIEPGEVEAALLTHPDVNEAVVVTRPGAAGGARLVAYVVAAQGLAPSVAELRAAVRRQVPEYMVPSVFCALGALPRNPNGKLDRQRLPEPGPAANPPDAAPPSSPVEEVLASIWGLALGLESVGVDDSFFDLGGHSLLATQVVSRVRESFGIELPLASLFATPTVVELARVVEALLRTGDGMAEETIPRLPAGAPRPLSFAQQRFWLLQQMEPNSPGYNVPLALELEGGLRPVVLARALAEIVRRHEVLRTTFPAVQGRPTAVVTRLAGVQVSLVDLRGLPAARRNSEAQRLLTRELRRPFDLAAGPLWRPYLVRLEDDRHLALLTLHHIVSDGWSSGVMVRELAALYSAFLTGEPSPLPELPLRYSDFAAWQQRFLAGPRLEHQMAYWRRQLDGVEALELPLDHERHPRQGFAGEQYAFSVPGRTRGALETLCRERGATLFMGLLAAFDTVLYSFSGQPDIVIGSPIAYRNATALEGLIGPFASTLVLRADLSGNPSFVELLDRLRGVALSAYSHQDVPFEKLVEELAPQRVAAVNPLFQVWMVLQNLPPRKLDLPGLRLAPAHIVTGAVRHDLRFGFVVSRDELAATLDYRRDLFERSTIERMARRFARLLDLVAAVPSRRLDELAEELKRHDEQRFRERKATKKKDNLASLRRVTRQSATPLARSSS